MFFTSGDYRLNLMMRFLLGGISSVGAAFAGRCNFFGRFGSVCEVDISVSRI